MKKNKISHNVILRLPRYLRYLGELQENGTVRISSGELGRLMGITASQIRQDFSCFGEFGQQGYGYNVQMLMGEIADILGVRNERTAVIIGAGNLGRAIIGKFPFDQYGFRLSGVFDSADAVVGQTVGGLEVMHVDTLEEHISDETPDIAILTMPGESSNAMAGRLIDAGVKGIWNFTNVDLKIASSDVVVENIHFSDSLLVLSYYMTRSKRDEEKGGE